ncbi:MAG TPA: coniferyl aldehyde dehydrogenase [Sphingobacteriaceae bacterium]
MQKEDLERFLKLQQQAFLKGAPDYSQRLKNLELLREAILRRQPELLQAVSEDFGGRAHEETLALELFPLYDQIRHARRHLKKWMKRRYVRSSWFLMPSRAFYQYQPLGVVGILGAWNYPVLLTLGPMVEALAAGNHVLVKPSEIASRSAEVLAAILAETFPPEYVTCITGGPDLAAAFTSLPFDHLIFTGSTRVGQLVMGAAAANLVPVTLELGGKSPVIIHPSYPLARAVERIMTGKLYNAGQTCVAPDYILLPEGQELEFEQLARSFVAKLYPALVSNIDYTRIINVKQYQRLEQAVEDAVQKGGRVITLNPSGERGNLENKVFLPTLVFEPNDEMILMKEEIFGPVLPVVTYKTLQEAIDFVNARPKPLALYYFDNDSGRVDEVLLKTLSGGVTINDCMFHLGQHNLPFGGVGPSGMGHYHGFDGFVTFSKKRAVMVQRNLAGTALFRPPYAERKKALLHILMKLTGRR